MANDGAPPPSSSDDLSPFIGPLVESYKADPRGHRLNRGPLPSRREIVAILEALLQLLYPGYYGRQDLTDANIGEHVAGLMRVVRDKLATQVEHCLCHGSDSEPPWSSSFTPVSTSDAATNLAEAATPCDSHARRVAHRFLERLPELRRRLLQDVQAAFDGDPAAHNLDEIILAYPGFLAITVYRVAHELHEMGVPLMPRIMTEWAHAKTGADIHPGATIGPSFFLDHATGAVVGETTRIGERVKLYQGVTLGALSLPRGPGGRVIRGAKRHPTVEDDVTVYANATVLGGETILGERSVVGGSVFLTKSVPSGARVALNPPDLRVDGGGAPNSGPFGGSSAPKP